MADALPAKKQVADDPRLTTGQVARSLGVSRQHVVDLCDQGRLPFESVGTHRRIRRSDVLAFIRQGSHHGTLTRDQLRSLWLHQAVAGKLVMNPNRVFTQARRNLDKLRGIHRRGQAARWLDEWSHLLHGPAEGVLEALTSRSQRGIELRQNSPFAGVLTEHERQRVLRRFSVEMASAA